MCKKRKIIPPKSTKKYKKNKEYNILRIFEKTDDYGKNIELQELLSKSSLIDYKNFFEILKKVEDDKIKVEEWKIQNSLSLLFEYIINNKYEMFNDVFEYYLNFDSPFKSYPDYLLKLKNKNEVADLLIKNTNNSKYYFLSFLLNSFVDEKYLENIKNFLNEQKNNKNKYTLNLLTIVNYSKYDSSIIDNKYTLECLYLKTIDKHVDCKGYMGFLLVKNNYHFFKKIIDNKESYKSNKCNKIIENIWKDNNFNKIILNIYNEILNSKLGYLNLHYLFKNLNSNIDNDIKEIQKNWLKSYIECNKKDKEKIKYIFYVICEIDEESKKELILFLLDLNNNFEIFKSIQFFSSFESWSNSRIPLIESKISFLENLKNIIFIKSDIKYIKHIDYINNMINGYNEDIKKEKIKEYLEDFYS